MILSATIFSCKVTWVPGKSPTMIANVIDVQNSVESLYDGIVLGDKGFIAHAADYATIDNKIDSIVQVNKSRDYGRNILTQSLILQKNFKKYEAEHEGKGSITAGEARVYKSYLKSLIKPILVSELSLK